MGRMEWSVGGEWDNCNSIINKYIKNNNKMAAHTHTKILSLFLNFAILIMMCLGVGLFGFILIGTLCAS